MKVGQSPDYILKAKPASSMQHQRVGAAWKDEDGRIHITLDIFVILNGGDDIHITLFPKDKDYAPK